MPIKPSSLLTYSLEFLTTTFFASTSAKILISVFLFLFLPKTDLKFLKYLIAKSVKLFKLSITSSNSASIDSIFNMALSISNFEILLIF